jgi:hypothetical protein
MDCVSRRKSPLLGANNEFAALNKCFVKVSNDSVLSDSCSISDNEGCIIVRSQKQAPHMDVWIYDVD